MGHVTTSDSEKKKCTNTRNNISVILNEGEENCISLEDLLLFASNSFFNARSSSGIMDVMWLIKESYTNERKVIFLLRYQIKAISRI